MAITLVSSTTVGSGGASAITFSNIPQTGKDLLILISARSNPAGVDVSSARIRINNAGGEGRFLRGQSQTVSTGTFAGQPMLVGIPGANATANTFGNSKVIIHDYTSSVAKYPLGDIATENNSTAARQAANIGVSDSTAAVTSVTFEDVGDTLDQYTIVSLYIIS